MMADQGFSAGLLRSRMHNLTALNHMQVAMSAWGGQRLDADGEPCSGHCSASCALTRNPAFMPACLAEMTCPPQGVAGYKIKFRTTITSSIEEFDAAAYKTSVARFFTNTGAPTKAADVKLTISGGSINVEAEVQTPSLLSSQIMQDALSNVSTADAAIYFNASVATFSASGGARVVSGESGTLGAPDAPPAHHSGGSVWVYVFLLLLAILSPQLYLWYKNRTADANPLMKSHQLQNSGQGQVPVTVHGQPRSNPLSNKPKGGPSNVLVTKDQRVELAEAI